MTLAQPTQTQPARRHTSPALMGFMYSAGGMMNGFVGVSLAQLLTSGGVSLARESEIATLILTASYISFLFTPLVDCALPRRVWALLLAACGVTCLVTSVFLLQSAMANGGHGRGANVLMVTLFLAYLSTQMYGSTLGGMIPNLVAPSKQSAASAWLNIAYLALTGGGGALAVWEIRHFSRPVAAVLVALPIMLAAAPLFFVGKEARTPRPFREAMRAFAHDLWATVRQKSYLFALLVFGLPSATFALQNLFGGMGPEFHTSDNVTNLVVGIGFTLACALGAAIGGPLSNRIDRRLLFIAPAIVAAISSLAMAFGPRTPLVFAAGIVVYNLMAGINYTATNALVFQIVGRNNPLSATQYSVCIAVCNLAITGALFADGHAAGRFGVRGSLIMDAMLSLVVGAFALTLIYFLGGGFPRPPVESDIVAPNAEPLADPV